MESEGTEAWQPVKCHDCGSEWNDIVRLIDADEIVLPEDGPVMPVVFGKKAPVSTHRRIQEMKPVKTEGNFVVYKDGARRAAFATNTDAKLSRNCNRLLAAAKRVVENWEHGDLAAAAHYPSTMNPAFQEGFAPKGTPFDWSD